MRWPALWSDALLVDYEIKISGRKKRIGKQQRLVHRTAKKNAMETLHVLYRSPARNVA